MIIRFDAADRLRDAMVHAAHVLHSKEQLALPVRRTCAALGSAKQAIESGEEPMRAELPDELAFVYSMVPELARYMLRERAGKHRRILSVEDVRQHLLPLYLGMHYECGFILCLDEDGNLLDIRSIRLGSVSEAPFYARIIVEDALLSGGVYFVLAHNHPGGVQRPSDEDLESTENLLKALHRVGLCVIDHVIFADGAMVSIRQCGRIKSEVWDSYAPLPAIYRRWPL